MLRVESLCFSYGEVRVLRDVSIAIENKQLVSILGSNGAGKTTLLKNISGLYKPEAGQMFFEEERIDDNKPHAIFSKGLIQVPEGRKLFPDMTVEENLSLGVRTVDNANDTGSLFNKVYSTFPILEERKTQKALTLSGGEQQQLAIARALMGKPRLLIFDEPTLGLSPILASEVFETIKKLNKDEGITILLVSQDVINSLKISDYGFILENGTVSMKGTSEELQNNVGFRKAFLGL